MNILDLLDKLPITYINGIIANTVDWRLLCIEIYKLIGVQGNCACGRCIDDVKMLFTNRDVQIKINYIHLKNNSNA